MPPYIIFSDKTLIDMSAKAPHDREGMLCVSGVGEAKYEKYGERFIRAIASFMDENPDSVTGIADHEDAPADRRNRPGGAGAPWTENEDEKLKEEYRLGMKISEIAKAHDRTYGAIRARLKKHGLIE